jgi:hypothetical protein
MLRVYRRDEDETPRMLLETSLAPMGSQE